MPRKDHAVVMARFAEECLDKMTTLTKALESSLGPDTGDLSLRIGLHSGPVTVSLLLLVLLLHMVCKRSNLIHPVLLRHVYCTSIHRPVFYGERKGASSCLGIQ